MEGNQMKMREALEEARDALDTIMSTSCHNLREITASRAYRKCREALALSPRQCDVGTAEEQAERYLKFCRASKPRVATCDGCPLANTNAALCEFAWAQMPYEAERQGEDRAAARIRSAKRCVMAGKFYKPRFSRRIPDWVTMSGELDVRSPWLVENMTPEQAAYARELAIERRERMCK